MSLLDSGRETVIVYPEEVYSDTYGDQKRRPASQGVEVTGVTMQPMSTLRLFPSTDPTQQQRVYSSWRMIARGAPMTVWSRVEWPSRGMTFSVRSGPEIRQYSATTEHVTALLQEER